ncbi:hypothetical protein, partial [Pseudomonas avellanae]|uniref:hypothetical protein n=1 Tax=Pseudomonas avellanae TaxID=46257 RepID=UPI0019D6B55D
MSLQTLGVRKNTIVPMLSAHRYTTLLLILAGGRGATLFAKALFRATHLLRMSRPFRGQVR